MCILSPISLIVWLVNNFGQSWTGYNLHKVDLPANFLRQRKTTLYFIASRIFHSCREIVLNSKHISCNREIVLSSVLNCIGKYACIVEK